MIDWQISKSAIQRRKVNWWKNNYFGDDKTVTDLTEPTLKPKYKSKNFLIARTVRVSEDYAMRPDLISMFAYGTDQYTDIILKFNGISNPFSLSNHP